MLNHVLYYNYDKGKEVKTMTTAIDVFIVSGILTCVFLLINPFDRHDHIKNYFFEDMEYRMTADYMDMNLWDVRLFHWNGKKWVKEYGTYMDFNKYENADAVFHEIQKRSSLNNLKAKREKEKMENFWK